MSVNFSMFLVMSSTI